ncbi:MAG: serine hydrolase [Candidatus Zixiibacteriota bacterium]
MRIAISIVIVVLFHGICLALESDVSIALDGYLSECHNRNLFHGTVLVAKDDSTVFCKGYGLADTVTGLPNGRDIKYRIGSITKQFTTLIIFQLAEEGKLRFDDRLETYIPEFRSDIASQVTVDHLLRHMSGIPSYTTEYFWQNYAQKPYTHEEFIAKFLGGKAISPPGEKYQYCNTNTYLLGVIIERVTGESFEENLNKRLLKPLKLNNTRLDSDVENIENRATNYMRCLGSFHDEPYVHVGNKLGTGGILSTVDDLYAWLDAFSPGVILSDSMITKIMTPYYRINRYYGYAYGWNIHSLRPRDGEQLVWVQTYNGHLYGAYASITYLYEESIAIIITSNHDETVVSSDEIINILFDKPYQIPSVPPKDAFGIILDRHGLDSALSVYADVIERQPKYKRRSESDLNMVGYDLLRLDRKDEARQIFEFILMTFPRSANAYDSFGEVLLAQGDTTNAIVNYKKSLRMNPANENAQFMVNILTR